MIAPSRIRGDSSRLLKNWTSRASRATFLLGLLALCAAASWVPVRAAPGADGTPPSGPSAGAATEATHPAVALMPPSGHPEGWDRAEEPRLYLGDALYKHINGGAEAYLDRGFRAVAVALFQRGDAEVTVEIYDMGSPRGALAIWKLNTGGSGSAVDSTAAGAGSISTADSLGDARALDPYQILFRRGPWYVSVTRFDDSDSTLAALHSLAGEVDKRIGPAGTP